MSTQPLNLIVREFVAQLVATGGPTILDRPFSPAGFRIILGRKRVRGTEELLAPFGVRAPSGVTHYLWSSSVVAPGLAEADSDALRDEIETILFRYLNPLDLRRGRERTVWLLSETEQNQLARVMALPATEEADYIFIAGPNAQWTGPIRGLHKTMATLAHLLSRHPDFSTGKVMCKPPTTFLFLGEARGMDRVVTTGIGVDGRNVPSRGIFAVDTNSYMDALVQLGEDEARDLAAVEFYYTGNCTRAQGPLGIPLYRIPHPVPASSIRSITQVNGNKITYEASESITSAT
ncbi:MAG: hypothetical protein JWO59_2598 [Chloroflexi bacterium]|nr:hypothetical protein [Chloroflexota bacterium]